MTGPPVYIVDGARTPFLRAHGEPGPFTPVDLAVQCGRLLLLRQPFAPEDFDLVTLGCVNVIADEMNPARVAALRLGMGPGMVAFTEQINCGSGMLTVDTGARRIREGRADLVLAGGTEALSHSPLVFRQEAVEWFADLQKADGIGDRVRKAAEIRPDFFKPVIGLERGLTDPISEFSMGQTAEVLAYRFDITREAADAYALESHQRLAAAQQEGRLDEIEPAYDRNGGFHDHDDGVRPDTSLKKLAGLKPAFETPWGKVTPGNSSQVTDGACWLVLASEAAVERYGLTPVAAIRDAEWSALDPAVMGLGPTLCVTAMLKRHGMGREEVDLWEINEAFAAQVLACLAAWEDADYSREVLGLEEPFGAIPRDRLNVDGGAVAIGHPVGTSGARIVLHLAREMARRGLRRGVATECIGGGQGGAMLLEAA
ncbi:MAG: acetyl-CoA C-acetyltransferase [Roseicyclus sp.]